MPIPFIDCLEDGDGILNTVSCKAISIEYLAEWYSASATCRVSVN